MHHIEGYEEAEDGRARRGSSVMAYMTSQEGGLRGAGVGDEERSCDMSPGAVRNRATGDSVPGAPLEAPGGQTDYILSEM